MIIGKLRHLIAGTVAVSLAIAGLAVAVPAAHAATTYYYFEPEYNQSYCIHDPGSVNGTKLVLRHPCPDTTFDAWAILSSSYGGGFSQLVNEATGKCLDDYQDGPSGTAIDSYTCNGTKAQAIKAVPDGLKGQAWQFANGLRLDNGSALIRAWTDNGTKSQAWTEVTVSVPPAAQYFGLGASQTNVQADGWDGVYPLSDSYCSGRVQKFAERVPANTTANNDVPPAGTNFSWGPWVSQDVAPGTGIAETAYNFSKVDGNVPKGFTTDEILEWAACKWGMDQNIAKGEAIAESNWLQSNKGDLDSCGGYDSYGILQVRATNPSVCTPGSVENSGWGGYPWTANSTAVDADAQMARLRAVYDGQSYMGAGGNGNPVLTGSTSTAVGAPIWNAVSTWQSGTDTGPDAYTSQIQSCLASSCWTTQAGAARHS